MKSGDFLKLVASIIISFLAGFSSFNTIAQSIDIISRTDFVGLVLASSVLVEIPAWVAAYMLVGIALFLVWRKGLYDRVVQKALGVFGFHVFLNILWSTFLMHSLSYGWLFFGAVFLWIIIIWMTVLFYRISKLSAYLLIPYIFLVGLVVYLHGIIWIVI